MLSGHFFGAFLELGTLASSNAANLEL